MEDETRQNGSCFNGRTEGYDLACKSPVVVYHYVQQELRDWGKSDWGACGRPLYT